MTIRQQFESLRGFLDIAASKHFQNIDVHLNYLPADGKKWQHIHVPPIFHYMGRRDHSSLLSSANLLTYHSSHKGPLLTLVVDYEASVDEMHIEQCQCHDPPDIILNGENDFKVRTKYNQVSGDYLLHSRGVYEAFRTAHLQDLSVKASMYLTPKEKLEIENEINSSHTMLNEENGYYR